MIYDSFLFIVREVKGNIKIKGHTDTHNGVR